MKSRRKGMREKRIGEKGGEKKGGGKKKDAPPGIKPSTFRG